MDHPEAGDELLPGQQGNIPIYEGDEWPDFGDGEEDVDLSDLEDDEESEGDDEEDTGEDTDSE